MKYIKKVTLVLYTMILGCIFFCGCNKKEADVLTTQKEELFQEAESESVSKEVSNNKKEEEMPVPKNKKEEEELFGKRGASGKFIPPKGAYKDKNGYIYNEYGVLIGGPDIIVPGAKG